LREVPFAELVNKTNEREIHMRIRSLVIINITGCLFGYLVLSPFTMWISHLVHVKMPIHAMKVWHVLLPQYFVWWLPFSVFSSVIGLIIALLYNREQESIAETRQIKEYNELVLNSMSEGVLAIDKDYQIIMANKVFLDSTGYSLNQVIGQPCYRISHGFNEPCRSPDHVCLLREVTETGQAKMTIHRHQDKYGRHFYVEIMASPVKNRNGDITQVIECVRDITERIMAENALQESEDKYRLLSKEFTGLLNAIPDVLALHGPDLKILWTNKSGTLELHDNAGEPTGQYCYTLWHNRPVPCDNCPVLQSFETGMPANQDIITSNNRIWDTRSFPLQDETGNISSVIEVARDITAHRRLEAQLYQAQKMEAIGQLASGVAHDFNNLLAVIIGYADLLFRKLPADASLMADVEQILATADRASVLTKSLLTLSRKQPIYPKPVKLNDVVANVVKLLNRVIGEDIALETVYMKEDFLVAGDSGQLGQVLLNLATNARDAMPKGGCLTITTESLIIDQEFITVKGFGETGPYGVLSVRDTGMGMTIDTRDKIFEPFFTTKDIGKGTGLGLSIAYGIIQQHHGFIRVESEANRGTTFFIYLPAANQNSLSALPPRTLQYREGNETILLAENDAMLRQLT
jgi:two-component system cell cycle sensor histidine kinase/response regulator CckA